MLARARFMHAGVLSTPITRTGNPHENHGGADLMALIYETFRRLLWLSALLAASGATARENIVNYLVEISPDGSRLAVAKTQRRPRWELFEGVADQPLRKVPLPKGTHGTGTFLYSPDGNELLFGTEPSNPPASESVNPAAAARAGDRKVETLWRRTVGSGDAIRSTKVFEYAGISNVQQLLDGSILFMGLVRQVRKPASPLRASGGTWSNYSWTLRKPDGGISVISPREYAFFSQASLIRDEAVFFVEPAYVSGRPLTPRDFRVNVTALRAGADLSDLVALAAIPAISQPRLQCDWSGRTCIRATAYTKNKYHAHQLEVIRQGKSCKVINLPDRLERTVISRSGNATAAIARPSPYSDLGYQLVRMTIGQDGCAGAPVFSMLP